MAQSVFTWTSHHALRWDGHLVESQEGLETEVGPRAELVGAPGVCSLLPNCTRNPHVDQLRTVRGQQATEVLGQEFLDQISPERHMSMFYLS
ncbi:hypothetical protein M9H77_26060 [Catharanthus roseus]|uniref:Uncharacterized protein n=1 Tax=Catharanthus roseus TaxID=4058 RepID=A0ACC0A8L9_CATRO|nr:hypothetical protein M9H77_26060 [Catharanthus roseus]